MASSCFTITFCLLIFTAPFARLVVTIIGNISGVNPTATVIANRNASNQFHERKLVGSISICDYRCSGINTGNVTDDCDDQSCEGCSEYEQTKGDCETT